jgi:hypothetical protein
MKKLLLLFVLLFSRLGAEIEFSGFFLTSKAALFTLSDRATQQTSGWLKIGQTFAGYTVESFDRETEIVTLKQGERRLALGLRQSAVRQANATIRGTITLSGGRELKDVQASLFFDEAAVFPLEEGITLHLTPSLRPDGTVLYTGKIEQRKPDGQIEVISAPKIVTRRGEAFGLRIGDYGFAFKP